MPTVLVTGAGGFLGGHLVHELLRHNYTVRAMVRPTQQTAQPPMQTLAGLPVEVIEGNVCELAHVLRAAQGCQFIIHAAALAQVNPARNPAVWAANAGGTANVVQVALTVGVERLVYVGTANVFGFGTRQHPGNETRPFAGVNYGLDYMDSKVAATRLVEQVVQTQNLRAVLVHPTFMLGPSSRGPSSRGPSSPEPSSPEPSSPEPSNTKLTSNSLLLEVVNGKLPGYPAGGKNYVDVRDVAVASVNALTQGRVGESYILGNENLSYREAFGMMARLAGVPPPRWPIPPTLARLYGFGCELKAQFTGQPAQVNASMVTVANDGHYFSSAKAIRELALPQTPIEQTIQDALKWFRENGYRH